MKKLLIISIIFLLFIPIIYSIDCDNALHSIDVYSASAGASRMDIGDLDGDGDNDIVVSDTALDRWGWYNQTNNGVFGNIIILNDTDTVFNSPSYNMIFDIDDDGDNDIFTSSIGKIAFSENTGSGVFPNDIVITTGSFIYGYDIADLDNDGDYDIVYSNADNKLTVLFNDGSENFGGGEDLSVPIGYPKVPEIVDLDSDGDNDIVVGCSQTSAACLMWFENNGFGSFDSRTISTAISIWDTDSEDLDGDGDIDIVAAAFQPFGQAVLAWFENDGSETFTQHNISKYPLSSQGIRLLTLTDLDDDGDYDIVTGNFERDEIIMWENDGNGNFQGSNLTAHGDYVIVGDVTNDNIIDVVYYEVGEGIFYIDGLDCPNYPTGTHSTVCDFPSLFCDDFNYISAMSEQGWLIQLGGGQINNSFIPIDDKLKLQNIQNIFPYHETEAFETSYRPDSGSRFTRHELAPIFSSQFYLNMINQTDNQFFYTAMETQNMIAYSLKAEIDTVGNLSGNMNWFYMNESQPSVIWKSICRNCTTTGEEIFIKINSLFAHRPEFPFNSSIPDDEIHLYADYELIGIIEDYLDTRTTTIKKYEFGKLTDGNYTIDDYYVMVGTDTETPTFEQYYEDYFIDDDVINETVDYGKEGTGDMATALATIWDDMGLLSIASRIMTGLFLMFVLALIMFAMALKTGHPLSMGVLILVEMFFMILLVYIKLLPIWLPFVIVLIAAGVGAAVIKLGTQT